MAAVSRTIFCELSPKKSAAPPSRRESPSAVPPRIRSADPSTEGGKIVLQPRLCTLRSYGSGSRDAVIRRTERGGGGGGRDEASNFFASLADYIESARKSHDFEIVSGRLAMIAFAAAVSVETVTGDSIFKKLDLQQIAEAAGVCVVVVTSAAAFAWFSSARNRIGQILTLQCNTFVDSLIDNIVDGLFYDSEDLTDWSDEI